MTEPSLQPPGTVEEVRARSVLVVAPHYDDEVLGCGGLLLELIASGAAVRVVFLTDGRGGEEDVDDRDAYGEARRAEAARAAEILGLAGVEHLNLPDGSLVHHVDDAASGIRRALWTQRPDLLLVPSPLEITADHRAAFTAVHRLLAPLRDLEETDLAEVAEGLTILAYEVNHGGFPDLLVDVTGRMDALREAMNAYAGQESRHPYWNAAVGLRRFRTLTLTTDSGVEAAEGYRRLAPRDFATHSPAQLVERLGGRPIPSEILEGPKVSVVVRTLDRPALLREALESLAEGSYRRVQVVLVNDGGKPPEVAGDFPLELTRVDLPETRGRAAAAQAGVEVADGDYVAFLDDDDLAAPEHLTTLAGAVSATGSRVVYSDACVAVYELTGDGWTCRERRLPYSRDFDPDLLLLDNYIPFNTLLIARELFEEAGGFDPELPFFEDWDFLIRLARITPFHHLKQVTCEYRHFRGAGHHVFGERPRERDDFLAVKAQVLAKHAGFLEPSVVARAVDRLRSDWVDAREAAATRGRDLRDLHAAHQDLAMRFHRLERDYADLQEAYHRAHGEVETARKELEALRTDVRRLYDEEAKLRAVVADQEEHLGRTYAEIRRLEQVVREMEGTRAWRAHQWIQKRRG